MRAEINELNGEKSTELNLNIRAVSLDEKN